MIREIVEGLLKVSLRELLSFAGECFRGGKSNLSKNTMISANEARRRSKRLAQRQARKHNRNER